MTPPGRPKGEYRSAPREGSELVQHPPSRHYFWASVLAMAVASALSFLDLTRTICDAANHWLQLHGLWHLLTAAAIYLAFLHLRLALRR